MTLNEWDPLRQGSLFGGIQAVQQLVAIFENLFLNAATTKTLDFLQTTFSWSNINFAIV